MIDLYSVNDGETFSVTMAHGKPGYGRCNLVQERTSEAIRSEPPLTNIIEKRRSLQSTHNVQSGGEHAPSQDTRQPQFLRIGHWPNKMTPDLPTPSIALEPHGAIRRTGTDLQNEETSIGTACSRTLSDNQTHFESEHEPGESCLPHNTPSSQHSAVLRDRGQDLPHDYYQFEWFRILIGMVLLMVSQLIIATLSTLHNILRLWEYLTMFAIGLLWLLLYTAFFVVLMEYHGAVESFLSRYARLRPGLQHFCLRLCAYVYLYSVLAVISGLLGTRALPL